jgi:hypothetical protein
LASIWKMPPPAKRAANQGPVFITDRGRPAHVLLSICPPCPAWRISISPCRTTWSWPGRLISSDGSS